MKHLLSTTRAFLVCGILFISTRVSAQDQTFAQVEKEAQAAAAKLNTADAAAQATRPNETLKRPEDKLDQAERAKDDLPANATAESKKAAQDAVDKAKADADAADQKWKDDGGNTQSSDKAEEYRKKLQERRNARKELKPLIARLRKFLAGSGEKAYGQEVIEDYKTRIRNLTDVVKKSEPVSMSTPTGVPGDNLASLLSDNKIKVNTSGTGETIGHIADLEIQNLTDQPVSFTVPPMVLESGSGKNQHYACPKSEAVALDPHGKKRVPMDGVCLVRNKPAVGKGVTGDLLINDGKADTPQSPDGHLPKKDANKLLRLATSKYEAADKLQREGAFKDIPYTDKQKQKDIVVQWSTWSDPRISELTGAPPATKEDLKKVVYKQVEERGPVTPDKKKKIDEGIDNIFEKVELTTTKAKDLEEPDPFANVELTGEDGKGESSPPPINISDETPTPVPAALPKTDVKPPAGDGKERPTDAEAEKKAERDWDKLAPKIDREVDESKTTSEPLPNGNRKKIYKNSKGQRVAEEEVTPIGSTKEKKIIRYHANGNEAEIVEVENFGDKATTTTQKSAQGLPIRIEVVNLKKKRKTIQTWPPGSGKEGVTKVFRLKSQPVTMSNGDEWEPVEPGNK